jgi:hypothetical protein
MTNKIDNKMQKVNPTHKAELLGYHWTVAYSKTRNTIWSSTREEHLDACLRMIENYERLVLDFGPTSLQGRQIAKGTVNDLLSLTRIKRKMIRKS